MTSQGTSSDHQEVLLTDAMAEAGRKLFAQQLSKMQSYEEGSRTGEDIESVHQMRVATRRMRSLFKLVGSHYTPKTVKKYNRGLRDIARALGLIRDVDVLILDLQEFQITRDEDTQTAIDSIIQKLDKQRHKHRIRLNALFDSGRYAKFNRQFGKFTAKSGRGAIIIDSDELPHQVRHVLPIILHECLATVRAYETVLDDAEDEVLHALRVEFKQLRYAVEFFKPVLGASADNFIKEVKLMQDLLGRINDIAVFCDRMNRVKRLSKNQQAAVDSYVEARQQELDNLRNQFDGQWQSFNRRAIQRQFADALLVLR